jgi:acyl carrier protein
MNATPSEGIREAVRGFVVSNFYVVDAEAMGDDTSLVQEGIVDSTGMLEVLAYLERTFSIRVDDAEVVPQNLDSIGNIVAFVARKWREAGTA